MKDLDEVHELALKRFTKTQSALRDERLQCVQDRRFATIAGAQWEGPLGIQFQNKPKFEVNKIYQAVNRIISEYKNNRISVKFISKDDAQNKDLADTCAMLYRATEQESVSEEAYDNAFEEAVLGGFGAWRIRTEYETDEGESEDQRICIEPIFDADISVFFDLDAKRQDKSDAKYAFIIHSLTRDAYKEQYDDDAASWPKIFYTKYYDWLTPDVVYVCEYYTVEERKTTLHVYQLADGTEKKVWDDELNEDDQLEADLKSLGYNEIRRKKVTQKKVHKYILSANKILEDCGQIAGSHIPIVPVYGKRWFVDNVERCMGHVRLAKDSQRIRNMQLSKIAEYAALSSLEKPIFTKEQIAGHQNMWNDQNIQDYSVMLVNQLTDQNGNPAVVGPVAFTRVPQIPPAVATLLQVTDIDMKDVLGNPQAAEQILSNVSGKAIELVQTKVDMQTYVYVSNMAKAVKRCGEIWLSIAKEIFTEKGRKIRGYGEQGESQLVELMSPVLTNGSFEITNDLSRANLDVAVSVGPSTTSKKQSIVDNFQKMLGMITDSETQQVLASSIMMNLEAEGISDIRDYFRRKLIKIGVVKPTNDEQKEMQEELQGTPPDANTEFLKASALQAQAQAEKSKSESSLNAMREKESEAKAAATLAGIDLKERAILIALVEQLGNEASLQPPLNVSSQKPGLGDQSTQNNTMIER